MGWDLIWEQLGNIFRAAFNEDYRDYDVQWLFCRAMTEYWLISAPGEKTCQQTFDRLNQVTEGFSSFLSNKLTFTLTGNFQATTFYKLEVPHTRPEGFSQAFLVLLSYFLLLGRHPRSACWPLWRSWQAWRLCWASYKVEFPISININNNSLLPWAPQKFS